MRCCDQRWRRSLDPKTRTILLTAGGLGLALAVLAGVLSWRRAQATRLDDFWAAPAFALTDQFERPVRSEDLAGQVVVANFIYTNCRDICPVLSLRMQQLQERLRTDGLLDGRVQLLSFSVDPEHDTPAVLRAYAERHQANPEAWRFLSGPGDVLLPLVVDGFRLGVEVLPPPAADHSAHGGAMPLTEVMHSGRFVLIDQQGRVRAYYHGNDVELTRIVQDLRALLR